MPPEEIPSTPVTTPSEGSTGSPSSSGNTAGEQSLDEIVSGEQSAIAEMDSAEESDASDGSAETASEDEAGADEEESEGASSEETSAYKPNLKYKIQDKELEIDEFLRPLLKDEESEAKVKDMLTKVNAFDDVKAKLEPTRQERDAYRQNLTALSNRVGELTNHIKSGDLESFFEGIQLSDDKIADYILEKARILQLPKEQQDVYNERRRLRRENAEIARQNQEHLSTVTTSTGQARLMELDTHLSAEPQVKQLVEAFDKRNGTGAFRKAVLRHGLAEWHATKQDLPVTEAVKSFIKMTGLEFPKAAPKPGLKATQRVVTKPKAKTLPNFGNSQTSPTAKKVKSIADLKQIYKEKYT